MIRNRPTPTDAEIKLKVVKNLSSQAFVRGDSVYYLAPNDPNAGTTPNGIVVGLPLNAPRIISLFAGIIYDDAGIAVGSLGQIQTSGFANYARVAGDAVTPIAVGDFLLGLVNQTHLSRSGTTFTHIVAMETVPALAAVAGRAVLLRCPE